jgi:ribosomal protein S18 acetylase RimI-like enzyme
MPPGKNMDDLLTIFRSGMWRLNYKLSAEAKKRFFTEFLPLLHDVKASVLGTRDHQAWYLVYIGCKLASRGRGYARKLIEDISRRADEEGRPCYLESSNGVNVRIYERMGFDVRKKIHLQRAEKDVELDIMVREPKRHTNSALPE